MKYFLIVLLWILWCFLHSFFTATRITAWFKNRLKDKFAFYRIFYNLLSLITVLPLLYWQRTIPGPVVIKLSPFLLIFKYIALALSAIIISGSFFSFDIKEFLGIRQITLRRQKTQGQPHISKHGFYGIVRHPMYLGYWLVLLGVLLTYRTWTPLALLAMTVPSFYRRAQREEVSLDETFGTEWQTYVASVPMFLPRLKTKTKENQ